LHLDDDALAVIGLGQEIHTVVFFTAIAAVALALQQVEDNHRSFKQGG